MKGPQPMWRPEEKSVAFIKDLFFKQYKPEALVMENLDKVLYLTGKEPQVFWVQLRCVLR